MSDTEQPTQMMEEQPAPAASQFPDIFGGDSDLSELEPSDDEQPIRRSRSPRSPARSRSRSRSASASGSPHRSPSPAAPSDGDGEGDDYQDDAARAMKKLGKIGKKKRAQGDDERDGEPRPAKKKKKTSSRKAKSADQVEPEEDDDIDPETLRRRNLAKRLNEIAKKPKGTSKSKKKKQQDEEDLEMLNDEAVAALRSEMMTAADRDTEENELGRPAVHKLRMLAKVVDLMQKTALAETIVEGGLLEAVKRWLEPLPDRSLPALNIQRPLFNLLRTLPSIETSALKSSGLGKIVYFYTRCKRVDPTISRVANQLVSDWMRPILRRSKAFVDRDLASGYSASSHAAAVRAEDGASGGAQASRHARIPQAMTSTFVNAPRSNVGGGSAPGLPGQGSGAKLRQFKAKLTEAKAAAKRM
ncbi:hypothetical protein JCM10207_003774 [Rhodosporidiobolus poonsookiae]